jgi:hypothetical protein
MALGYGEKVRVALLTFLQDAREISEFAKSFVSDFNIGFWSFAENGGDFFSHTLKHGRMGCQ